MPFPVIVVTSFHGSNKTTPNRQVAQLVLPRETASFSGCQTDARNPNGRDKPATTDIELRFERSARLNVHYVAKTLNGDEDFWRDEQKLPKAIFPETNDDDLSPKGDPQFRLGPVNLPLKRFIRLPLTSFQRDVFGRWGHSTAEIKLTPWPVSAPTLISGEILYEEDGGVYLDTTLSWDWSIRTPAEFRIGIAMDVMGNFSPEGGIRLPGIEIGLKFSIRFTEQVNPELYFYNLAEDGSEDRQESPGGFCVNQLSPTVTEAGEMGESIDLPKSELRTYLLRTQLGSLDELFINQDEVIVSLCTDASEIVSGKRRSKPPQVIRRVLQDPRPPVLKGDLWKLHWTSRRNAENRATATLHAPPVEFGKIAGYHVWRTHESAVLDLAVEEQFGSNPQGATVLDTILHVRDMGVRLLLIQGLVEQNLWKPKFRRAFVNLFEAAQTDLNQGEYELSLPGSQSGLEFAMFSAVSSTGVASDKTSINNLYAIAVPAEPRRDQPTLRILTSDISGTFAFSGLCLALVGTHASCNAEEIRFFWDARTDVEDADQLLHRLEPVSQLTPSEAQLYVPEIKSFCDQEIAPRTHIFLLQPPQSWSHHSFAVDTKKRYSRFPSDEIPSTRSVLVKARIVPFRSPQLSLTSFERLSDRHTWTIKLEGLLENPIPGYTPCEIYLVLRGKSVAGTNEVGPIDFADFAQNSLVIGELKAKYVPDENKIDVTYAGTQPDVFIRIVASDPVSRFAELVLETEESSPIGKDE